MQTKPKFVLLTLACLLFFATSGWAGFEESHAAYTKGDYTVAFNGYLEAANSGDSRAYGKVAALYLYGRGTNKDYIQAYIWFGIAKESKDKYAARFQDAAASMLTMKQIDKAEAELAKKREKLSIKPE